ncbi:MAG: nitrate reductase maturation protein NarM [Merismopedia sp. SIO2A8]|nr:nitrate reductase maturation protein NarM [Merismopedia sp. SIO2A8]
MTFFQFEDDFVQSLKCIPMQVRFKLDTCGVKLKLAHWHTFSISERETLVTMPCTTADETQSYKTHLQALVTQHTGAPASELVVDPDPAWLDANTIPSSTQDKATSLDIQITVNQWRNLSPLQRFALIKLSRPSHENRNFLPAAQEFNLIG